ncbi:MAG: cytochrome c [Rhodospirillaceae bacterium]
MTNRISHLALSAVFAALVVAATPSVGHADDDAIAYRQTLMKGVGAAMGGLKMVVQGKASADSAKGLAMAMNGFATAAATAFPKGSGGDKTRAKDDIWSRPAEFAAALGAFQKAAAGVVAASNGGGIKAAFGALGGSCGGCHKPFRKPKS